MKAPWLALALGFGLAAALPAQQAPSAEVPGLSEEDIFGGEAFDQSVEQSRQEEKAAALEYLVGGVFLMNHAAASTAAFDSYTASGSFSGKSFVKLTVPGYGSVYLGGNFRHYLYQAQAGLAAPADEAADDLLELAELYVSFDIAKKVFFRIGDQLIAWGPSIIWTPVDFINAQKADSRASVDLRVGKPGLRVHVPLRRSNLFLFADLSEVVSAGKMNDLAERTNFGLRWDLTALGAELGLTTYLGADIQNRLGLDLSSRLLGIDVYGEAAVAFAHGAEEASYGLSTGFQRVFGELKNWTLQGEFFYNSAGQEEILSPDFTPFYVGKVYGYLGLTKQDLIGTVLDGTLSAFQNMTDGSFSLSLKGSFDLPKAVPFSVSLTYTGGEAGDEFTYFSGQNGLSASVQVRFEF